jgi:hypothetical protein
VKKVFAQELLNAGIEVEGSHFACCVHVLGNSVCLVLNKRHNGLSLFSLKAFMFFAGNLSPTMSLTTPGFPDFFFSAKTATV